MALSKLFDPRDRADTVPARIQYSGRDGSYSFVASERDPRSGQYVSKVTPVKFGTKLVADFGRMEGGWLRYSSFDDSHLIPLPHNTAEAAAAIGAKPGPDYVAVARLPVFLQNHGLAQWTIGGVIAQNSIARVRVLYYHAAEAARGDLPVIALMPSRQVEIRSRNNELHYVPVLEIVGWVPRDDGAFGPNSVPPPVPILSSSAAAAPQLSPPANDDAAPAATQVSVTPPWEEQPTAPGSAASLPANDATSAANDLFAAITPATASTGKPKF